MMVAAMVKSRGEKEEAASVTSTSAPACSDTSSCVHMHVHLGGGEGYYINFHHLECVILH